MMIDVMSQFRRTHTAVWATTYTFEPSLLDDYIFRHLGEPPLNVNIIADGRQSDRLWERCANAPWRFRRVNRDYLVRPVHRGQSAFHPKTYLLAGRNEGTLLVGSGNLSMNGLARGREVFCEFNLSTDEGRAAIAIWRQWMERVVHELDDFVLTKRWKHLLKSHSWLPSLSSHSSSFVHNLDRSILDQFIDRLPDRVDELYVLAPFYDRTCYALAQVLARVAPRSATIYLPDDVSIDGQCLSQVVAEASCEIRQRRYSESEYIHAKLIGCVAGERGVLLSGSPNISKPALCETVDTGNSEVAIIAQTLADVVRNAFVPDDWTVLEVSPEAVAGLAWREQAESTEPPRSVSLTSVTKLADGRLYVRYQARFTGGSDPVAAVRVGADVLELVNSSTLRALQVVDVRLASLVDAAGKQVSNLVPLDDETSLDSWLEVRAGHLGAPSELLGSDLDSDVGKMLDELNRTFIFDVEEIVSHSHVDGTESNVQNEDDLSAFWDNFDSELVRFDPRAQAYVRSPHDQLELRWLGDQELLSTLESMVGRFPGDGQVSYQRAGVEYAEQHTPPNPNIQVRVGNVLARWSKALDDPRFHWVDVTAPVLNYHALLLALQTCWLRRYLRSERIAKITLTLLQSFVGSDKHPGFLLGLGQDSREAAMARLDDSVRELGAAMVYAAMPPTSPWRSKIFEWQPTIVAAIEYGVISAGKQSVEALNDIVSTAGVEPSLGSSVPSESQIDDHLQLLATFINDAQWCLLQEEELGFIDVKIQQTQGQQAQTWPWRVTVSGVAKLRVDPRIVSLVVRTLAYKQSSGAIVEAEESLAGYSRPQRLAVSLTSDESISGVDTDGVHVSLKPVTLARLRQLEHDGHGFMEILSPEGQATSMPPSGKHAP